MNLRDHTHTLLARLADELPTAAAAGGAFELDQNDEFFLTLEEKLLVMFYLEEETRSLILNLPVGPLPEGSARETVLLEALRANYCWNQTEGATLGLDAETNLLCLSYLVPLPLAEPAQMPMIVSKLVAVTLHWQSTLQEIQEAAGEESSETGLEPMTMLRA